MMIPATPTAGTIPSIRISAFNQDKSVRPIEEGSVIPEIAEAILASFTSLVSYIPSWADLTKTITLRESTVLNQIEICFYDDPKITPESTITRAGWTITLGTDDLPSAWHEEAKQDSRLTNRGIIGHELGHCYFNLLKSMIATRVIRTTLSRDQTLYAEALEEHFCDLMGIGCRHLNNENVVLFPWSILNFEESPIPLVISLEQRVRSFNEPLVRTFIDQNRNDREYLNPHNMRDWEKIRDDLRHLKQPALYKYDGCCILNKVFYDFFTYLQPGLDSRVTEKGIIEERFMNPLHVWTISLKQCIEDNNFRFENFAKHTLSMVTKKRFISNHKEIRAFLKECWIEAGVLKDSPMSRIAHFFKDLGRKKEERDPDEGGGPGEGYVHFG